MEDIKIKEFCPCNQVTVIKKGFNGYKAVSTFITIAVLSAIVIFSVTQLQSASAETDAQVDAITHMGSAPVSHFVLNSVLVSLATMAALLGLFAGTINMNDLYSVCPKCGKVKELDLKHEKQT